MWVAWTKRWSLSHLCSRSTCWKFFCVKENCCGKSNEPHQYCHIFLACKGRLQSANVSTTTINILTTPRRARSTLFVEWVEMWACCVWCLWWWVPWMLWVLHVVTPFLSDSIDTCSDQKDAQWIRFQRNSSSLWCFLTLEPFINFVTPRKLQIICQKFFKNKNSLRKLRFYHQQFYFPSSMTKFMNGALPRFRLHSKPAFHICLAACWMSRCLILSPS